MSVIIAFRLRNYIFTVYSIGKITLHIFWLKAKVYVFKYNEAGQIKDTAIRQCVVFSLLKFM